eukprot:2665798-Rhodomonas_salina.1
MSECRMQTVPHKPKGYPECTQKPPQLCEVACVFFGDGVLWRPFESKKKKRRRQQVLPVPILRRLRNDCIHTTEPKFLPVPFACSDRLTALESMNGTTGSDEKASEVVC